MSKSNGNVFYYDTIGTNPVRRKLGAMRHGRFYTEKLKRKFPPIRLKEKIIHALHIIDAMLWKFAAYHSTYTKHPLQQARLTHQSTAGLSKYFRCLDGDRVRCKTTSDD
ncbi:uncharacterized protein LOC109426193 [Aedes albopictus]|uniref:Uncharacterized protein n=1 Tax=Aedes albopictus TaxID=7160 RepID=A0ABM1Y6K5_AEDAL